MDEEIETILYDKLKPYNAITAMGDSFPAIGIVAAVLGVIKAMGKINEPPAVLGGLIGAALVGTHAWFSSFYSICNPLASQVKIVRSKAAQALRHREADTDRLYERLRAAGRTGIWTQDHLGYERHQSTPSSRK